MNLFIHLKNIIVKSSRTILCCLNKFTYANDFTGNGIGPHDLGASSSDKRLLSNIQVFASPSSLFYRLHGVFMFTAWIGTTTLGVFLARYYKQQWKGRQFMNKDIWFVVRFLMIYFL